jgi:hypothetical protein
MYEREKLLILKCLRDVVRYDRACSKESQGFLRAYDWDWIIETSRKHRLAGFLAYVLKRNGALRRIDRRAQTKLDICLLESLSNNQRKQEQFQAISAILQKEAIDVIPLKGVALSNLLYRNIPFREMDDIDILVKQSDFKVAFNLLIDAGFQRSDRYLSANRWHRSIYAETAPSAERVNIGRVPLDREDLSLDLHFNPRYVIAGDYLDIDWPAAWRRAEPFPKLGPNVYMLGPKDQLTHLLLHTVDLYRPFLIQVLDVALAIKKYHLRSEQVWDDAAVCLTPARRSKVDVFTGAIHELIDTEADELDLSASAREVFELFFSRKSGSAKDRERRQGREAVVSGLDIFQNIASPWKRAIFIAGYFLPDPSYYQSQNRWLSYFTHWRRLLSKAWKLSKPKKDSATNDNLAVPIER